MKSFQNIAKSMAKRYAKILFKKLLVKFLIATSKIWGTALLIFILVVLAYLLVFELPKQAILGIFDGQDRDSAFEYGQKNDEASAMQKYPEIAAKWSDGLTEEQLLQVEPYELDWAWLAAVDRTLGDPEQSGTRDAKELVLDPEATFDLVRPIFEWVEAEKVITHESCEVIEEEDDEGNKTMRYEIHNTTTRQPQILLTKAQTVQGVYLYSYRTETESTVSQSLCGTLTTTETFQVLSGITTLESDWGPLKKIMRDHGIEREEDQSFLLEYWLSFLTDPDGSEHDPLPDGWSPVERDLKWPTVGRISSRFGYRIHPITGDRKLHAGVDIAAPKGTEVYAAADGKVVHAGFLGNAGLAIILDHGDLETRYYHLGQVDVRKGVSVTRGDNIGKVGSTGASTGPHLHFEIRIADEPVDPLLYYTEGGYAE